MSCAQSFGDVIFEKLHGLGNDFVLIDARREQFRVSRQQIKLLASRTLGVGCDQVLILRRSKRADAKLEILNADGSRAEMCGNGLRAAALYLWRSGAPQRKLSIETDAGILDATAMHPIGPKTISAEIECNMGVPRAKQTPRAITNGVMIARVAIKPVCVDVGNPHAVCFAYPQRDALLAAWGAALETHRAFPRRTNAEFVRVRSAHAIDVKVWERGVGITKACGTGAVASAVAAITAGKVKSPVTIHFPGGRATVRWEGPGKPAYLRGTAHFVFSGSFVFPT